MLKLHVDFCPYFKFDILYMHFSYPFPKVFGHNKQKSR